MHATIGEIAARTGGSIRGNPELTIFATATLDRAECGMITFVNGKLNWERFLKSSASAAVISGHDPVDCDRPVILVEDAEVAFAELVSMFRPRTAGNNSGGISPHAWISPTAKLGQSVNVQPHAFVGDDVQLGDNCRIMSGAKIMDGSVIGNNVTIFPNAVLYENTHVGDRVLIHAGAIIGAYGFGYRTKNGRHLLCPQLGCVRIESDVEIGAGTTIDRGTFDDTIIGEGTKIDDQVMIGHNCRIGRHNLICSQVGIAGSCTTGDYVVMGGQVGIGDHLRIGNRVNLCAGSGVMRSIQDGETHFGVPSKPVREQMQILAISSKLPEFRKRIKSLESAVDALRDQRSAAPPDKKAA